MPDEPILPMDEKTPQEFTLLGLLKQYLPLFVGLATLSSVIGFIVVNISLSSYSTVQGLSIAPSQYVATGASLLISSLLFSIANGLILRIIDPILSILLIPIIPILKLLLKLISPIANAFSQVFKWIKNFLLRQSVYNALVRFEAWLNKIDKNLINTLRVFAFFYALVALVFSNYYFDVPRSLGGGQPTPLILIFKEKDLPELLGLPQDAVEGQRTQVVFLLADLNDGVLVLNPTTGLPVAVRSDMLIARVGDMLITPTPTASITPSATITSTPSPSGTP